MRIDNITAFTVQGFQSASMAGQIAELTRKYSGVPEEYTELIASATEIELTHACGAYLRIYGAVDAMEMDEGYDISECLEGAILIGDDGNSRAVFYWNGRHGKGLYMCSYSALFPEDVTYVSPNLTSLLRDGVGVHALLIE